MQDAEFQKALKAQGADAVGNTSQEFSKVIRTDFSKWRSIASLLGLKVQ
jgi:tripartite-type tricarboxylate transporter receptor subunit TctC